MFAANSRSLVTKTRINKSVSNKLIKRKNNEKRETIRKLLLNMYVTASIINGVNTPIKTQRLLGWV